MVNWCIVWTRKCLALLCVTGILNLTRRPVDIFVTYDGKRASDIGVSRYAVRHLVASEVC